MTNTAAIARHSHWGLVLLNGLLLVLSGLFLAAFPFIGAFTFTAAFGMYLVALGAVGLFAALRAAAGGHGSVLAFVGPPLAMLVGVIFWLAPEAGLVAVMEFAGAFTLVAGVFQIAAALGMAGRMHWGLMLLNGLLTLGAGICMLAQPGIAVLAPPSGHLKDSPRVWTKGTNLRSTALRGITSECCGKRPVRPTEASMSRDTRPEHDEGSS